MVSYSMAYFGSCGVWLRLLGAGARASSLLSRLRDCSLCRRGVLERARRTAAAAGGGGGVDAHPTAAHATLSRERDAFLLRLRPFALLLRPLLWLRPRDLTLEVRHVPPLSLASLNEIWRLKFVSASLRARRVRAAAQFALRFAVIFVVRVRVWRSACEAYLCVRARANVSAVPYAAARGAHFVVLPIQAAAEQHRAVLHRRRHFESLKQDHHCHRVADSVCVEHRGVVLVD